MAVFPTSCRLHLRLLEDLGGHPSSEKNRCCSSRSHHTIARTGRVVETISCL